MTGVIALSISLNSFGQKCEKFINYQTRAINIKGLSLQAPSGIPANLLPVNVSTMQRATSERLEMLDMLQYNLCQKMASIKIPVLKETMQVEYSNFLMEIMSMLVAEAGSGGNSDISTPTPDTSEGGDRKPPSDREERRPPPAKDEREQGRKDPPTPLPQPEVLPVAGKIKISFPCRVAETEGVIRAFGMEESSDPQIARQVATTVALSELASKIEISVKSAIDYQVKRIQNNQDEEFEKRYEMKTEQTVEQTLRGWRTVCEEYELDQGTNKYSCYVVIEISEENALKPIYNELTKDSELKEALPPLDDFKEVFKSMNNIKKGNSLYVGF